MCYCRLDEYDISERLKKKHIITFRNTNKKDNQK